MDELDRAQEAIELEASLRALMHRAAMAGMATSARPLHSECLNCSAALQEAHQATGFCDRECMDEWEYDAQRRRANGGQA